MFFEKLQFLQSCRPIPSSDSKATLPKSPILGPTFVARNAGNVIMLTKYYQIIKSVDCVISTPTLKIINFLLSARKLLSVPQNCDMTASNSLNFGSITADSRLIYELEIFVFLFISSVLTPFLCRLF